MKKQILNIGKALSKAEQKLINGGVSIFPTYWDDMCDHQGESGSNGDCSCSTDSNCLNMAYWTVHYDAFGDPIGGWVMRSGTCDSGSGICVGA